MTGGGWIGPVFALESLVASRRWQLYAGRMAFVAVLLACLSAIWRSVGSVAPWMSARQQLVEAGRSFFAALTIVEFMLVLAAAPAATAGAICLEKSRGGLALMFATDLRDAEIVVGKLLARVVPVVSLLVCALPVSALSVLLGGVEPLAMALVFVMAVGLALLGCSLTVLVSVWGTNPHEVLAAVYATLAAWLLPRFVLEIASRGNPNRTRDVLRMADPFYIAIDGFNVATASPGDLVRPALAFFGGSAAVSLVLTILAVRSLRPAMDRASNRRLRPVVEPRAVRRFRRDVPWWPSPSLDRNPVLWREWHRSRPSRLMRVVWALYLVVTGATSLLVIARIFAAPERLPREAFSVLIAFESAIGLLLMSLTSATSLAEERARGSLDVLLATPMPTRSIVWGKWRGTFRLTTVVLFWPFVLLDAMALHLMPNARVAVFYVLLPYGIAWGAFVSSLGLAAACWTKRMGRALGLSVTVVVGLTVGAMFLGGGPDREVWATASPFWGMGATSSLMENPLFNDGDYADMLRSAVGWAAVYAVAAAVLLGLVFLTFDAAMGRVPDRPRSRNRRPRRASGVSARTTSGPPTYPESMVQSAESR